jgi:hypothetical protein
VGSHYFGPEVAEGFFHEFSGWLIFLSAFVILLALQRAVQWISPQAVAIDAGPAGHVVLIPEEEEVQIR